MLDHASSKNMVTCRFWLCDDRVSYISTYEIVFRKRVQEYEKSVYLMTLAAFIVAWGLAVRIQ